MAFSPSSSSTQQSLIRMLDTYWSNLDELYVRDPVGYQNLIKETERGMKETTEIPLPHTLFRVKDDEGKEYYANILSWKRLKKSADRSGTLPLAGGFVIPGTFPTFNVAINTEILQDISKGSVQERDSFYRLILDFIEETNVGIKFKFESFSFVREKNYRGDLSEIQNRFMNPNFRKDEQIVIRTNSDDKTAAIIPGKTKRLKPREEILIGQRIFDREKRIRYKLYLPDIDSAEQVLVTQVDGQCLKIATIRGQIATIYPPPSNSFEIIRKSFDKKVYQVDVKLN